MSTGIRNVDLRSDTFTLPSPEMLDAVQAASFGDDVYEEDPTVRRLEARAAELTGKPAALLVTSGSQGNLIALMTHGGRGDEVLLGRRSDLYNWETGSLSAVASLYPRPLDDDHGYIQPDAIAAAIRPRDVHFGRTRILAIENSHQWSGGTPIPPEMVEIYGELCRRHGLVLHVDGARLFNAAVALDVPAAELLRPADSATFCLSKGLSCPIGAVLCGSAEFIGRARVIRKMLGGGMRQAGWIAAPGLVALDHGIARLAEDHRRARALADGLARIDRLVVAPGKTRTNIVLVSTAADGPAPAALQAGLAERGVRCFGSGPGRLRMVVHRMIDDADVDYAVAATAEAVRALAAGQPTAPKAADGAYAI